VIYGFSALSSSMPSACRSFLGPRLHTLRDASRFPKLPCSREARPYFVSPAGLTVPVRDPLN
jgi:hypothetical protein